MQVVPLLKFRNKTLCASKWSQIFKVLICSTNNVFLQSRPFTIHNIYRLHEKSFSFLCKGDISFILDVVNYKIYYFIFCKPKTAENC